MHADGCSGFNQLDEKGRAKEIACMAHVRRKFVDIFKASGLKTAEEAIKRIACSMQSRKQHAVSHPKNGR